MPRLTQAPDLKTLATLAYDWRRVAHNPGFGEIMIWFGDLNYTPIRNRFSAMVREGKIICVTNRTGDGGDLFAKISINYNPNKAHQDSLVAADKLARMARNPFVSHHRAKVR